MNRRLIAVIGTLVILTGLSLLLVKMQNRGAEDNAEHAGEVDAHAGEAPGAHEGEAASTVIPGLKTQRIELASSQVMLALNGEVQPNTDRIARVGSPVSGRIVSLRAKMGDRVKAGQTLALVASRDVADVASALTRAQADESAAMAKLQNVQALVATGALTQKPLEEARHDYDATLADFKQAETSLVRAKANSERMKQELERIKKLAATNAFQARPVEDGQRELAQATAEIETAQATVAVKQAAFNRSQRLLDVGLVAQREVESASAELDEAKAREKEAKAHFSLAKQALDREENIASQDLYTVKEVRDAQAAAHDADKENDVATAELQRTRAHLKVAEAAYAREKRIASSRLNAKTQLREAQTAVTVARAEVQAARNSIAAFRATGGPKTGNTATIAIIAPLAGIITERQASPGQAVDATDDLFTLTALDTVWVIASAYEKDLAKIAVGQPAVIRVNSYSDKTFYGKVTYISKQLDPKSRTAQIRCAVPNQAELLKPGMFAAVEIGMGGNVQSLYIPRDAVLDEAGKKIVFIACADCPEDLQAGKSVCGEYDKLQVEVGLRRGNTIEIKQGLEPGAEVVVEGQYQLKTALGSGQLEAGCADGH